MNLSSTLFCETDESEKPPLESFLCYFLFVFCAIEGESSPLSVNDSTLLSVKSFY